MQSANSVCHIDPHFTGYLVMPICWLSSCTACQYPTKQVDILRSLKLHLRPCFQLGIEGRFGSGLDFQSHLICSPLGQASHSRLLQHKSHNSSGSKQKKDTENQGAMLTGGMLAIVCALAGRNTYKVPWLHLVLCQLWQSIAVDSNADLLLNSIRIITQF